MIRAQHEPATEQEGYVQDTGTDYETEYTREGEAKGDKEHVVLVQVA